MAAFKQQDNIMEVQLDNMRLDEAVIYYYGSLDMFDAVLAANPNISQVYLMVGDKIVFPDNKPAPIKDVMW